MASKPPKGIEAKTPFLEGHAEIVWHLLQTIQGFDTVEHEHWKDLAFGLLGGIDIAHNSNLLKDRPARIQIQVHRTSIQQFCRTLQLGFELYPLTKDTSANDIQCLLDIVPNLFLKTRFGIWKIFSPEGDEDWWATNLTGKTWHQGSFTSKKGDQLFAIEDVSSLNIQEVLHLSLSEHTAHFINASGVQSQLKWWTQHLRRVSLRKSWSSILTGAPNYYWSALQVYREINVESDVAYRELYIHFLLRAADLLNCETMKGLAIKFRQSTEKWQRLSTLLLDGESTALSKIPELDWLDFEEVEKWAIEFSKESKIENIPLRLQVFETTLNKMFEIEKNFFIELSGTLSGLVFGSNWASENIPLDV